MAAPLPRTFIEIAREGDELERRAAEWDELSRDAIEPNVDRFLLLEAGGWKGRRGGNALNGTAGGRPFFLAFMEHFRARGRALLLSLQLDGREIAMKCNLLAADGRGSFAFKIAHDEAFARYSPGVLLEVDNIRRLHEPARGIGWMDSCADPDHPMIDHLWRERRRIEHIPVHSPHWVKNGDEVSVSFSVTFRSAPLAREASIHWLNGKLRRFGLSPRPPGRALVGDGAKAWTARMTRTWIRRLRRAGVLR